MLLRVDPSSSLPLYDQIASSLRTDIVRGELRHGDRLPTARDVAESLGVNLHTVLKAYQTLRDEGLIDMRRGRGAVVVHHQPVINLAEPIGALVDQAIAAGVGEETLVALVREQIRAHS